MLQRCDAHLRSTYVSKLEKTGYTFDIYIYSGC